MGQLNYDRSMRVLMLVLAGSDFTPPDTIDAETQAWVETARSAANRGSGGRLHSPEDSFIVGSTAGSIDVGRGPRVSDDEQIVGFDVLECADMDTALDLVKSHPMARAGRIELREVWDDAQ